MRVRFWCESTRDTKNVCDTVVAHFLLLPPDELPRTFPTKARSHFPITALNGVFVQRRSNGATLKGCDGALVSTHFSHSVLDVHFPQADI